MINTEQALSRLFREEYQFIKSVLGKIESIEKYIVKIKDNSI